jgi:hypothetical protein
MLNREQNTRALTALNERYEALKSHRARFDSLFDWIQRLVRPNSVELQSGIQPGGDEKGRDVFDSTAPWASEQFASGLSGLLTPTSERFFSLGVIGMKAKELDKNTQSYLENVADRIYAEYANPAVGFYSSAHEIYHSIASFGTASVTQLWEKERGHISFRARELPTCYFDEDSTGSVDTVFRRFQWNQRQLLQKFPDVSEETGVKNGKPTDMHEIIHLIAPVQDIEIYAIPKTEIIQENHTHISVYFCPGISKVLKIATEDYFVYHVPRWSRLTGEVYGRSPAMSCLPSIKMVNRMMKETIMSAELANAPPMLFDEDSILLPVDDSAFSLQPNSILWRTPGAEDPKPLISGSKPEIAKELIFSERERIIQAFYVDHLIRERKRERQSVTEILDDRGEMVRQMAPMLGRLEEEWLTKAIEVTYHLLTKHEVLPPAPESLVGRQIHITYNNAASKVQLSGRMNNVRGFLAEIATLQQGGFEQDVHAAINAPVLVQEAARYMDVPPDVIRSKAEMEKIAKQQQEQQQQQQMMGQAPGMAKAAKDMAQAQATNPGGIPGI